MSRLTCVLSLGLLASAGCKAGLGETCATTGDCKGGLVCFEQSCLSQPSADGRCRDAALLRTRCSSFGYCTAQDDRCVAGNDGDCEQSSRCRTAGACTAREGHCVAGATQDADCDRARGPGQANPCELTGSCKAVSGECVVPAATDAECDRGHGSDKHNPCKTLGTCTAKNGHCVASRNADCQASAACKLFGQCTATAEGRCVVGSDADCREHEPCKLGGLCKRDAAGQCVADREEDCQQSVSCRETGACAKRHRGCAAASDADCQKSEQCRLAGRCVAKDGVCHAGSEAGCRASELCKRVDLCTPNPDVEGACTAADCAKTRACATVGLCTKTAKGCIAASDADCKKSKLCEWARCHAASGVCVMEHSGDHDLGQPRPVMTDQAPDASIILIISKSAILLGEEGEPIVKLPSREQLASQGLGAEHKRNGNPDERYLVPLAERLQKARAADRKAKETKGLDPSTSEAIIVADASTPFRLLIEVLYTLGQCEIGRYHLLVLKKAGEPAAAQPSTPAPTPKPAPPPDAGASFPKTEGALSLHAGIGADGITLWGKPGNVAPGCQGLGPGVTVPLREGKHDLAALTACAARLAQTHPGESQVSIEAEPGTEYQTIVQVIDALRGPADHRLYPDVMFGVLR